MKELKEILKDNQFKKLSNGSNKLFKRKVGNIKMLEITYLNDNIKKAIIQSEVDIVALKEYAKVGKYLLKELEQFDDKVYNNRIINILKKDKNIKNHIALDSIEYFKSSQHFLEIYGITISKVVNEISVYTNYRSFQFEIILNEEDRIVFEDTKKRIQEQIEEIEKRIELLQDVEEDFESLKSEYINILEEIEEFNNRLKSDDYSKYSSLIREVLAINLRRN